MQHGREAGTVASGHPPELECGARRPPGRRDAAAVGGGGGAFLLEAAVPEDALDGGHVVLRLRRLAHRPLHGARELQEVREREREEVCRDDRLEGHGEERRRREEHERDQVHARAHPPAPQHTSHITPIPSTRPGCSRTAVRARRSGP